MPEPRSPIPGDRLAATRGERQRRAILDAVSTLLGAHRLRDLSVGLIATEAGLTRSGFYFYFDSKETAVAVALAEAWEELDALNTVFDPMPPSESTTEHVRRGVLAAADVWCRYEHVLVAVVQAKQSGETLSGLWDASAAAMSARLVSYIEAEMAAGRARPVSADLPGLVSIVLEMFAIALYQARVSKAGPEEMLRLVDTLTAVLVATIWGVTPDR